MRTISCLFLFLFSCKILFVVSQKQPPLLAQAWVADYRVEFAFPNQTKVPLLSGRAAIQIEPTNNALVGGYLSIQNDAKAPFLFESQLISRLDDNSINLYQFLSPDRCWLLNTQDSQPVHLAIPNDAVFIENTTIGGYLVEIWRWNLGSDDTISVAVRIKDGAVISISTSFLSLNATFFNIQVGKIDPRYYAKPAGNCPGPVETENQFERKKQTSPTILPPKVATAFTSNWVLSFDSINDNAPIFLGTLAVDQNVGVYVHYEDASEASVPFTFQMDSIINQASNKQEIGYLSLSPGRCWELSTKYINMSMVPLSIPSSAYFVKNDTIDGQYVQIWKWDWQWTIFPSTYTVGIRSDGGIVYFHSNSALVPPLTLIQKNLVVGPVDPSYFTTPIGCFNPIPPNHLQKL